MYEIDSVDILGVTYKLEFVPYIEAEALGLQDGIIEVQGLCDVDTKTILISETISDNQKIITARHEVLHAFLLECGLFNCSSAPLEGWAVNEEMIDFFALQWHKINKIYEELGLLE